MHTVRLPRIGTVAAWRAEARRLAAAGVPAEAVLWQVGEGPADLFAGDAPHEGPPVQITLPRAAVQAIETALNHSDPERFARAYSVVLRLSHRSLRWGDRSDQAMHRLLVQEKAVRRDIHKMHAFVRFREVGAPDAPRRAFAAWFEPEHPIVEAAAPFFARRFADMDWIIATPGLVARFENCALTFAEGDRCATPPEDATEELWRAYFRNIFNPARLMVSAMTSEMPKKYWKNLPEAALIPELIRTAPARAQAMREAAPTRPPDHIARLRPRRTLSPGRDDVTLETLKPALDACRRCAIGCKATQGVAGEGRPGARIMIVGEQPGDAEDLAGRPFIGPAGHVFERCSQAAGLDRSSLYITNAVKHFKFQPRGKRRVHQRPSADEISTCRWWLDLERQLIRPRLIVAMGGTAALSLTGRGNGINSRRGTIECGLDGTPVLLTLHPSHILRLPHKAQAAAAERALADDLRKAASF